MDVEQMALLIPILILQGAIGHPSSSTQAATNAASLLVTALAVQGAWLRSRHPPDRHPPPNRSSGAIASAPIELSRR